MKRYLASRIVASAALAAVFLLAGRASATEVVYYPPQVTGKKVRRQVRYFLYKKNLRADKRRVFDKFGYTPHRIRINGYGRVTERWQYLDRGLEFVFDADGVLVSRRHIRAESRRSGIYH